MKKQPTKRKDGRYRQVVDGRAFYGKTRRELQQKIDEYEDDKHAPKTFKTIADEWWEDTVDGLANQTLKGYKPALKRAIDIFGDMDISKITAADIHRFYKKLKALEFSYKTISNHKTIINQIFDLALIKGYIVYNPVAHVKLPRALGHTERPRASQSDEGIILSHPEAWIFPFICLTSGLRKGEVLALKWQDIDFEKRIIRVTKSIEHVGVNPYEKEPKTKAGNRTVPLLSVLADALTALYKRKKPQPFYYIVSEDGLKPLSKSVYEKKYREYQKEFGITCTAHQLRKSFASIAAENGAGIKDLQYTLGHTSSVLTLDTYVKAGENTVNNIRSAIDAGFSAQKKKASD